MDSNILNVEQAVEFLGVSEKTLIKLLREEHIPARKIGREWRFSKEALISWLSSGDSCDYINKNDLFQISEDKSDKSINLINDISETVSSLIENRNIRHILKNLNRDIDIPEYASLRISYKQQRDVEKLEFKIFWNLREDCQLALNKKK